MRGEGDVNPIPLTQVSPSPITSTQDRGEPRRSGRVVHQPESFIGLEKIPEELETDPNNYGEAIQDKDVTFWQKTMNTEMESMYSNQV